MKTTHTKLHTLALSSVVAMMTLGAGHVYAGAATGTNAHPMKKAIVEHIKAADTNNDGLISRAEADASLPKVAKHFDQLDTNKDGQISAAEFKAGHEKVKAMHDKGRAMHAAKIDGDKDGFVSRAEAEANAPRLAKHFDEIDANKDGKLSREEIQAARTKKHKSAT